jgi:UDPglucose 6-dehydrogenase/GDP-mannose 6-dehydrogenase
MKVSVIGTGYVGLVSGICLADRGHHVVCVDNDVDKVKEINNKKSPIYEDGLNELLDTNVGVNFSATSDLYSAVINSDISLLAVGTPFDGVNIDLKYVQQVAKEIGLALKDKKYHVVVVKSTVVPGTTDNFVIPLLEKYSEKKAGIDFGVGMNPEFLREGEAIDDFMYPDRIILGGIDKNTHNEMNKLYKSFGEVDILKTNNKTAEMIKYTSNSLLATLISFSNEIGNLCSELRGVDSIEVMEGVCLDKRISPINGNKRITPGLVSYLKTGCGFGGSCFPKDVNALIAYGKSAGQDMQLLKSVMNINYLQPLKIIKLIEKHYDTFSQVRFGVLGLAFKPGTDDMRESPAIPIINEIIKRKGIVNAYDAVAKDQAKLIFSDNEVEYHESIESVLKNSDVILLLTGWPEFKDVPRLIKDMEINPLVIDGRRFLLKNDVNLYEGVGLNSK